jgi:hypothetical protein
MPTNLPPDYFEIEKRCRAAESIAEKLSLLEEMYSVVPKHKGTDHLRLSTTSKKKAPGRRPLSAPQIPANPPS